MVTRKLENPAIWMLLKLADRALTSIWLGGQGRTLQLAVSRAERFSVECETDGIYQKKKARPEGPVQWGSVCREVRHIYYGPMPELDHPPKQQSKISPCYTQYSPDE